MPVRPRSRAPAHASRARHEPDDTARAVNAFRRIMRALRLAEQDTRARAGLSAAQLFVLRQVADDAAASLSDLAERTMTDRSSVAAVVERLTQDGLVMTDRDPGDRRRVTVRITASGHRVLREAPPPPAQLLVDGLHRLPAASRRRLASALDDLVEELGIGGGPTPLLFEESPAPRRSRRE